MTYARSIAELHRDSPTLAITYNIKPASYTTQTAQHFIERAYSRESALQDRLLRYGVSLRKAYRIARRGNV